MDKCKTKIMAILNVTPDSFSDGGRFVDDNEQVNITSIMRCVEQMVKDGADVIDIGGESTRPNAEYVDAAKEENRIIPVIQAIKSNFDVEISVDTYKASVAKTAFETGADIINDIGMMQLDNDMAKTVASLNSKYVLMHNILVENGSSYRLSGSTATAMTEREYMDKTIKELLAMIDSARNAGIEDKNIIIDPGIGFNKSQDENLWLMKNLSELCKLNYPVLLGCSRKSVIGNALVLPVDERLEGTMATSVMAAMVGVSYIRVHDVKENFRAVKMAEAIMYS